VIKRLGWLLTGAFVFWLLVVYPAGVLWGPQAVAYSTVALVVCLLPTSLTLVWAQRAAAQPAQQLLLVMGGTGLRMAFVLGVGLALSLSVPYFRPRAFWGWLLVFYLFTLAWEMMLLLTGHSPADDRPIQ
jgi:hypothetical protein